MSKHKWEGKSAVVCGATAGLGKAIAWELAAAGVASLALLARREAELELLRQEMSRLYPNLQVFVDSVDMCRRRDVEASVEKIKHAQGASDLLVQAVGQSDRGKIQQLTSDRLQELMDSNLASSLNAIQCFTNALQKPGGTIVMIGSLASLFAPRFLGGYAIAKHALAGLAQQARLELAAEGLHVLLACPGPIARDDAGERYSSVKESEALPAEALQPGGGAKIRGLDANRLAQDILRAAATNKRVIIRPRFARLLSVAAAISPRLGDYLLQRASS